MDLPGGATVIWPAAARSCAEVGLGIVACRLHYFGMRLLAPRPRAKLGATNVIVFMTAKG
jgi:hypothetical protein